MSRPKGKRAAGAEPKQREGPVSVSLELARKMIPLVTQIVAEIHDLYAHLTKLEAEQLDLDRRRRGLEWPERSRRYQVAEELRQVQQRLGDAVAELEEINVLIVDPVIGEAAFPTTIHGRQAYYVWRTGSNEMTWCYANEAERRSIPASWNRESVRGA
jgi:hypothetical protein